LDREFEAAVGQLARLLRFVPEAFADLIGGGGAEADDDAVVAGADEGAEGLFEELGGRKVGRPLEVPRGDGEPAHAAEGEGAQGLAVEVVADEIPDALAVREVVGLHAAGLGLAALRLLVVEGDLVRLVHRAGELLEELEVGASKSGLVEGDVLQGASRGEADALVQAGGKFFERVGELIVVGRALVLLEGLLCDEQGEQLAFADLHGREISHRVGIAPGEGARVVFGRQVELVAHERKVAHDGLGGDLQLFRQLGAVGVATILQDLVDADHPRERRTGGREDDGAHAGQKTECRRARRGQVP
jgi:hypothetical protein